MSLLYQDSYQEHLKKFPKETAEPEAPTAAEVIEYQKPKRVPSQAEVRAKARAFIAAQPGRFGRNSR